MTYTINIVKRLGTFASNKDIAREIRQNEIIPIIAKKETVVLDFTDVEGSTQSLIHALIAEPLQIYGKDGLNYLEFKSANPLIKTLIGLVIDYSLLNR